MKESEMEKCHHFPSRKKPLMHSEVKKKRKKRSEKISINQRILGLRCMTCENARSHQECDTRGVMKECMPNELACAIEERKINLGPERIIFKHCKQPLACDNNQVQVKGRASRMRCSVT
ncbi:unnamed protein product [Clavelina lepadiformis]|uniref:Snake toxin/toxin-like domain-containing protein n=1 Tax=Clavelina lepadiformis TaxID=159417 RepID=A0ABP0FJI6_CLALP